MSDDVRAVLAGYITEALDLRFSGESLKPGASPAEVLDNLYGVRLRLDRIEELHARALRVKARAQRAATLATATADDAFDRAAQTRRTAPVIRGDEFSSARERTAEANLATLDERIAARQATDLAHHTDEAVDVIRLVHRGLDGVRHDLHTVLRAMTLETNLER